MKVKEVAMTQRTIDDEHIAALALEISEKIIADIRGGINVQSSDGGIVSIWPKNKLSIEFDERGLSLITAAIETVSDSLIVYES